MFPRKVNDQKKLNFLWNAAASLRADSHSSLLLKSYYLTIFRKLSRFENVNIPHKEFGKLGMCQKCSLSWFNGHFSMNVRPTKVCSPRAQSLVKSLSCGLEMSKTQRIRAKWYRKKMNTCAEFSCKLCKNKTHAKLQKTKKPKKAEAQNTAGNTVGGPKKMKMNKKEKIDKPKGIKLNIKLINKCPDNPQKPTIQLETPSVKFILNNDREFPTIKEAVVQSKVLNIKKASFKKSQPPQIISKTQQKNNLIQLAEMLKLAEKVSDKSSQENELINQRLQNLLRSTF